MPPVGFEPTISTGERLQTYALDRAATGTGYPATYNVQIILLELTAQKNGEIYKSRSSSLCNFLYLLLFSHS